MNTPGSQTIEQALFENMGITLDDALATGTDFVDEQVARASKDGIDWEQRLSSLTGLLLQATEPKNLEALQTLIERLPQFAKLAKMVDEAPGLVAAMGDTIDELQQRCAADGLDLESGLINGLRAALWLGSNIQKDDLERLGELLQSDILSHDSIDAVSNAAHALNSAQKNACNSQLPQKVGLFGMLQLMRNPQVQKTVAFAARFAECFGKNLNREAESRADSATPSNRSTCS